jgi:hypothetical protein
MMRRYRAGFWGVVLLCHWTLGVVHAENAEKGVKMQTTEKSGIASQLIGTWRMISVEERRPNGEVVEPRYGSHPSGYIMYDTTGHVAVQIMKPGRARFASNDAAQATVTEAKAAFDGYGAYFGTYEINEAEGYVVHHVEGSVFPNYVGTDQKRGFELSGDQLILKPPPRQVGGEQHTTRVTWQRVK